MSWQTLQMDWAFVCMLCEWLSHRLDSALSRVLDNTKQKSNPKYIYFFVLVKK